MGRQKELGRRITEGGQLSVKLGVRNGEVSVCALTRLQGQRMFPVEEGI